MKCHPPISIEWSPEELPRGLYRKLFFARRAGLKAGAAMASFSCEATGVDVRAGDLRSYQSVIQQPGDERTVPLFYPHSLLGSAHLSMIAHPRFPFSALGLLHLRNHVIQRETLDACKPWGMRCALTRQRNVEKGIEFDFDSSVTVDGAVVWESVSTYLKRTKHSADVNVEDLPVQFEAIGDGSKMTGSFFVPHDIGRRYAKVTGDYNPIHVSNWAAKCFGFRRAIAHGMWTVASASHHFPKVPYPVRHDVAFKGPMLVKSNAQIQSGAAGRFDIYCDGNTRPVVVGRFCRAEDSPLADLLGFES